MQLEGILFNANGDILYKQDDQSSMFNKVINYMFFSFMTSGNEQPF